MASVRLRHGLERGSLSSVRSGEALILAVATTERSAAAARANKAV